MRITGIPNINFDFDDNLNVIFRLGIFDFMVVNFKVDFSIRKLAQLLIYFLIFV